MKRFFPKITALFVLIMALSFLISGTASAQSTTASRSAATTARAQALSPQCGSVQLSNWTWSPSPGNVNIIKWENTCNGNVHCEAIDKTFYGALQTPEAGIILQLVGSSKVTAASELPFQEGNILNTPALNSQSSYTCVPSVVKA